MVEDHSVDKGKGCHVLGYLPVGRLGSPVEHKLIALAWGSLGCGFGFVVAVVLADNVSIAIEIHDRGDGDGGLVVFPQALEDVGVAVAEENRDGVGISVIRALLADRPEVSLAEPRGSSRSSHTDPFLVWSGHNDHVGLLGKGRDAERLAHPLSMEIAALPVGRVCHVDAVSTAPIHVKLDMLAHLWLYPPKRSDHIGQRTIVGRVGKIVGRIGLGFLGGRGPGPSFGADEDDVSAKVAEEKGGHGAGKEAAKGGGSARSNNNNVDAKSFGCHKHKLADLFPALFVSNGPGRSNKPRLVGFCCKHTQSGMDAVWEEGDAVVFKVVGVGVVGLRLGWLGWLGWLRWLG